MADIDYLSQDFSIAHFDFTFDDIFASSDLQCPNFDDGGGVDSPDSAVSSYVNEIEKFLMDEEQNDEGEPHHCDEAAFLASLLVDGEVEAEQGTDEKTKIEEGVQGESGSQESSGTGDGDGDDQMSKKRKRQMRNRDAAMKSRERKKEYVKELEMKSRYLEQECRRLDYTLRCFAAENLALRQRLQMEKVGGVPAAKQESAVLFMESLLLGSLFVLVSTIFLFLMPNPDSQSRALRSIMARDLEKEVAVGKKMVDRRANIYMPSYLGSLMKRCRGMRTRIKVLLLPRLAV